MRVVPGSRAFWREVLASRTGCGVVVLRWIKYSVVPYVSGTRRVKRTRRTICRILGYVREENSMRQDAVVGLFGQGRVCADDRRTGGGRGREMKCELDGVVDVVAVVVESRMGLCNYEKSEV